MWIHTSRRRPLADAGKPVADNLVGLRHPILVADSPSLAKRQSAPLFWRVGAFYVFRTRGQPSQYFTIVVPGLDSHTDAEGPSTTALKDSHMLAHVTLSWSREA